MNFYPMHIGDYAAHTGHLSELEDLAFRRMIDVYYLNERPLPADINKIARSIRMPTHCESIAIVLDDFFDLHDDGWHNKRCDEEIAKIQQKSAKASESANARWGNKQQNQEDTPEDANAMRTQCEGNATNTHYPLPITQDPNTSKGVVDKSASDELFELFWFTYPKKVGKEAARKAWKKIKPDSFLCEQIKTSLKWQSMTDQWQKDGGQFIPNPATYLNQSRWLDQPIGVASGHGNSKLGSNGRKTAAAAANFLNGSNDGDD